MKTAFTVFLVCLKCVLFAQNPESEISSNWIYFSQFSISDPNQLNPIINHSIVNTDAECIESYRGGIQGEQSLPSILTERDRNTQVFVEHRDLNILCDFKSITILNE